MKFDYLREFIVAARSGELQQAASELGISLPTLSKHIKAVELEIGAPLFIRSRKTVLSQYGRIMLPYAQELIALQDEYRSDFASGAPTEKGELTIGLSPIQFRERSGALLEEFMLTNPTVSVKTVEYGNSELCKHIKDRDCDIALVRTQPEICRDPELVYYPLCADNLVAFLNPEHPLAREKSITFEQLKFENIYLRSENSTIYKVCVSEFEKLGYMPKIFFGGSFSVYDTVRRGEGITLYLAPPVSEEYSTPLAIVPVSPPVTSFMDIVFRRESMSAAAEIFFRFMMDRAISSGNIK